MFKKKILLLSVAFTLQQKFFHAMDNRKEIPEKKFSSLSEILNRHLQKKTQNTPVNNENPFKNLVNATDEVSKKLQNLIVKNNNMMQSFNFAFIDNKLDSVNAENDKQKNQNQSNNSIFGGEFVTETQHTKAKSEK